MSIVASANVDWTAGQSAARLALRQALAQSQQQLNTNAMALQKTKEAWIQTVKDCKHLAERIDKVQEDQALIKTSIGWKPVLSATASAVTVLLHCVAKG